MAFENAVSDVVRGVEVVGVAIMVVGGFVSFAVFARRAWHPERRLGSYNELRRNLGRSILVGLEVLIVADIVRTIVVDPTIDSVVVLGAIVLIRILLSFSIDAEVDGAWPWNRWRQAGTTPKEPNG